MAELLRTYASLRLQVVDACVIALAERLDVREVAAQDRRDFLVVAPRHPAQGSAPDLAARRRVMTWPAAAGHDPKAKAETPGANRLREVQCLYRPEPFQEANGRHRRAILACTRLLNLLVSPMMGTSGRRPAMPGL